jgi:hypothetical protein
VFNELVRAFVFEWAFRLPLAYPMRRDLARAIELAVARSSGR